MLCEELERETALNQPGPHTSPYKTNTDHGIFVIELQTNQKPLSMTAI